LQMRAALSTCARMHAFFWPGAAAREPDSDMSKEMEAAVWPAGTYWHPAKQAATQIDDIPARCEQHDTSLDCTEPDFLFSRRKSSLVGV
jgi:hypothetical protein